MSDEQDIQERISYITQQFDMPSQRAEIVRASRRRGQTLPPADEINALFSTIVERLVREKEISERDNHLYGHHDERLHGALLSQAHDIMLESMPEDYQAKVKARVKEISASLTHDQVVEFHNRTAYLLGQDEILPDKRYRQIKNAETWLAEYELENRCKTLPQDLLDQLEEAAHAAHRGSWDRPREVAA